jgi:hypothetical protein
MTKLITEPVRTLVPVHGTRGCVGFLLRTAKGFRAFDIADKEIGCFATADTPWARWRRS